MIETVTCYRAKCDGCGLVKDYAGEGDALFYSEQEAQDALSHEDWEHDELEQVRCPRCVCDLRGHMTVQYGHCVVCDRAVAPEPRVGAGPSAQGFCS